MGTLEESRLDHLVSNFVINSIEELNHQIQNATDDRDKRDAIVKLNQFLKDHSIDTGKKEIHDIKFNPQHLDTLVGGLLHLARYSGFEQRMTTEQIQQGIAWLMNPESAV